MGSWLKDVGFLQSSQLQANLSVVGSCKECKECSEGTGNDWVALALSPLQSKRVQTRMKTESSFCLLSRLSPTGSVSMPEPWQCEITSLGRLKPEYLPEPVGNRDRYLSLPVPAVSCVPYWLSRQVKVRWQLPFKMKSVGEWYSVSWLHGGAHGCWWSLSL